MHEIPLIQDLAIILLTAGLVTLVFNKIRQPVVLGYLIAGVIVGPFTPPFSLVKDIEGVKIWSELGVIFLMFALGLEFHFGRLKKTGLTAVVAGPFEAIFMLGLGYATGRLFGFTEMNSVFLGAILAISSTTVIIKALDELNLKNEKFAEVVFGILVIEDLVAILLLVSLATFAEDGGFSLATLGLATAKLLAIVAVWIVVGIYTIPRFLNRIGAKASDETLTVLSLGLCLGLVIVAAWFHYSMALGAFVMGAIIAESGQGHRIEKLLHPVRDVFGAVFFVSIGMLLNPADVAQNGVLVVVISLVTIIGKIISTFIGARVTGQSANTSLRSGFALAQIGEFSFIIASLGLSLGKMDPLLYSLAVSVAVITTFTTPYLIRFSARLFQAPA